MESKRFSLFSKRLLPFWVVGFIMLILLPLLNAYIPEGTFGHVSNYKLNLYGKFLCYAIVAIGIDLIWGFTGVLSLGQGVYFALGGYCMGMYLMLGIGGEGVYGNALPDFMVFLNWDKLPWYWPPFRHAWFALPATVFIPGIAAMVFGFFAFRSRIRGVYFAIITQALTFALWLLFFRNSIGLGGNNGLTDFKTILGFRLHEPSTMRGLYMASAIALGLFYLAAAWIVHSKFGRVLVAIRDNETRVRFSGYSVAGYKMAVFTLAAVMAGVAGALYVPQVGIINPSELGTLPSIEMAVWVAVGGRGTLFGAVLGAIGVNWAKSLLTGSTTFAEYWLYVLGLLFVVVVMLLPDGLVGLPKRIRRALPTRKEPIESAPVAESVTASGGEGR
ncbi:MAG: urea ABC transporter permease subunit UrtC [Candidatus Poribacteria bacterium]|nr:urea ABC transporter permease subunit UrtC [Candidatus Poribacteria bacterium]